jgi:hypothetical protein
MQAFLSDSIDLDIQKSKLIFSTQNSPLLNEKTISDLNAHYTNGLSRYVEKVRIETVTDLSKCREIWEQFSPNKGLFDLWEFRMFFHITHKMVPYFLTLKKDDKVLACLPLCYQESEKYYTWFGTDWQENCRFFSVDPFFVPILLYLAPKPLGLCGINETDALSLPKFVNVQKEEPNYYLDLNDKSSLEDYLASLNKKRRYNLKRDFKHIKSIGPQILMNKTGAYKELVRLTNNRFHQKGEKTDFDTDPFMEETFRHMVNSNDNRFETKVISVLIGKEFASVDITATFNNVYYAMRGGNDTKKFPGIGNFMNMIEIQHAISLGMDKIDFLQYNYGWKSSLFKEEVRYKYEAK